MFNPWGISYEAERQDTKVWGESSWMAVPFLTELPPSTKVFHLVRDPVKTINSIIGTGQLHWPDDYRTFAAQHCWNDGNYWPTDIAVEAQHFWVRWNLMIERSGRVVRRFRVESVWEVLGDIAKEIQPGWNPGRVRLETIVNSVPTNYNTRVPDRSEPVVNLGNLTVECRIMARQYGYPY
jgi:hypothetical protein